MTEMTQTVTHFVGPPVALNGRLIQRCAICGEKLLDLAVPAPGATAHGRVPYVSVWPVAEYLHYPGDEAEPVLVPKLPDAPPPEDCCISLVE